MLTIQNVRRDIGHDDGYEIGTFKLIDGGLSGASLGNLENPFYTFYWALGSDKRRFKVTVTRQSGVNKIDNTSKYYRYGIEDLRTKVVIEGHIDRRVFKDRKKFYRWMVDRIEENA